MRRRWLRKRAARKETFAIDTSLGRVRSSETTQVVDATQFIDTHPGGLRKLMSTDDAGIGAGPEAFSFSFSRGRNAHFPDTGRRFADGVQRYLRDGHATKIKFPPHGNLIILGRLDES